MNTLYTLHQLKKEHPISTDFLSRFAVGNDRELYTLDELSLLHHIEPELLLELILMFENVQAISTINPEVFQKYSLTHILRYLEITHDYYRFHHLHKIEELVFDCFRLPCISQSLLHLMSACYTDYREHIISHMNNEEEILFPFVAAILETQPHEASDLHWFFQKDVCKLFDHTYKEETSHNFFNIFTHVPPENFNFQSTPRLMELERQVQRFKNDLTVHAWIEQKVLIPRVQKLQHSLR